MGFQRPSEMFDSRTLTLLDGLKEFDVENAFFLRLLSVSWFFFFDVKRGFLDSVPALSTCLT